MMKMTSFAALLAAAALAGCGEETAQPRVAAQPAASQPADAGATRAPSSSATPPTAEERSDGTNPVQQQVDPKQAVQRRGFQHPNDKNGPTSPETQPKAGN